MKLKQRQGIFHVVANANLIGKLSNIFNQKWNNKTSQCKCKNYRKCIKDYSGNPSTCICEDRKYLKSIADTSVIKCD